MQLIIALFALSVAALSTNNKPSTDIEIASLQIPAADAAVDAQVTLKSCNFNDFGNNQHELLHVQRYKLVNFAFRMWGCSSPKVVLNVPSGQHVVQDAVIWYDPKSTTVYGAVMAQPGASQYGFYITVQDSWGTLNHYYDVSVY